MPKSPKAEEDHADLVEYLLQENGIHHLRVRRRGAVLTIESGPKKDAFAHARFRRDTVHLFCLEMPSHTRWEKTPFRDTLQELVKMLIEMFPWALAEIDFNPDTTSDPDH